MTIFRNAKLIKPQVLRKISHTINTLDQLSPCQFLLKEVILVNSIAIEIDGQCGFACVFKLRQDRGNAKMAIGAKYVCQPDISYRDWLNGMLPHIIAHEWVHLEQIRDGKNLSERGVEVRTRNLVTKIRSKQIRKCV